MVVIGDKEYDTYANQEQADDYLQASISYSAWESASDEDKARSLVEATRLLDRQSWREGYTSFEQRSNVEEIVNASIEIASLLSQGEADFLSSSTIASSVKRLKAGSAEIESFRDFSASSKNRFPTRVMELVGKYLGSGASGSLSGAGGAFVSGVSQCSQASQPWGYWSGI